MSDIQIAMKWNGQQLAVTVVKPLTQEQYEGLKVSPASLAHLLLTHASDDVLLGRIPRPTIEEEETVG
jgi:hypothetical protein